MLLLANANSSCGVLNVFLAERVFLFYFCLGKEKRFCVGVGGKEMTGNYGWAKFHPHVIIMTSDVRIWICSDCCVFFNSSWTIVSGWGLGHWVHLSYLPKKTVDYASHQFPSA